MGLSAKIFGVDHGGILFYAAEMNDLFVFQHGLTLKMPQDVLHCRG
jgi:hypothetical protein